MGVDIHDQPHYPFGFIRADALKTLAHIVHEPFGWHHEVAAIHASPPCQRYTVASRAHNGRADEWPDLIGPVRELLEATGLPYVIENVPGAPLAENSTLLCGTMFDELRVLRHRLFETNWPLGQPNHPKHPLVYTRDKRKAHYGRLDEWKDYVQVTGGGNCTKAAAADAMGLPAALTKRELNEAIPPAYTEFVGARLRLHLKVPHTTHQGDEVDATPHHPDGEQPDH